LLLFIASSHNVRAAPLLANQPVVHAVLFFTRGCPYCNEVLTNTLPPIQDQYQAKLSILLVEVATVNDIDNLYSLGRSLGLAKEQVSVPFL
jgi:hypothetical protein